MSRADNFNTGDGRWDDEKPERVDADPDQRPQVEEAIGKDEIPEDSEYLGGCA